MKRLLTFIGIVIILLTAIYLRWEKDRKELPSKTPAPPTGLTGSVTSRTENPDIPDFSVIAENLDTPWALAFLPDNRLLVTERQGSVRIIEANGTLRADPLARIEDVKEYGEGGLLGIAVHPDFETNKFIYVYYTYAGTGDDNTLNRVVRFRMDNDTLSEKTTIVDAIPGAINHNGGRIKFGPDTYLYIAAGDAAVPSLAQDKNSLAGKILRVTEDGSPAPGNPFNNRVYSYGHRNPQGLGWDKNGKLFAAEHGQSAHDELNYIEAGRNYGWPVIQGDEEQSGMVKPILHSGTTTWAPSGLTVIGNKIFYAGLRGQSLFEAELDGTTVTSHEAYFEKQYGRLRGVVKGPDGYLYFTTSNHDGRGSPQPGDDHIFRVNPESL